jgi:alpha-tubulin suppressor-like RCC1 family protein
MSALPAGTRFKSIYPAFYHTCAISTEEDIYCWGSDDSGRLGNGDITGNVSAPSHKVVTDHITGSKVFTQLSTAFYTCGLTEDHKIYCWGDNGSGGLGNGTKTASPTQAAVDLSILISQEQR